MFNFRDIGPLYCETPPVPEGVFSVIELFPLEPVNVVTSAFPAIVGLYLLWYLYRRGLLVSPFLILATATAVVGVGSMMWHGVRTELSLFLDWVPGFFSFIVFMFLWPYYLKGRWWGYATLVAVFGGTFLLASVMARLVESNGPPTSLFFVVAVVAASLLYVTWREHGRLVWWGVVMLACAIGAATARTVDLATCGSLPGFGTHAFWHIGLGLASLFGTIMVVRLKERRDKQQLNQADSVIS